MKYENDIVILIDGKYFLYSNLENAENETVEFEGQLFNKSDLSEETLKWLVALLVTQLDRQHIEQFLCRRIRSKGSYITQTLNRCFTVRTANRNHNVFRFALLRG